MANAETAAAQDGLQNLASGLGVAGQDKAAHSFFAAPTLTEVECLNMYRGTWVGKKLIDIPAEDMTREWRTWDAEADQIEKIEAEEKRLGLRASITNALRWSALSGGAALILGDGAPNPEEPLDPTKIGEGGLKYVACVTRDLLSSQEIDWEVGSDWYGKPKLWALTPRNGSQIRIHPSRVIAFIGQPKPPALDTDGWGDSVLLAAYDAILNAASSSSVIASLLQEAKLDIVTIPDLAAQLSTPLGESRLVSRFTSAKLLKSLVNTLIIGSGETFDQKSINFTNMPELHMRFLQEAAGALDMPVTRLMGQSPAGLSATGEMDLRNWYDKISKDQNTDLRPALDRIDAVMLRSIFGANPPEELYYRFPPLWQLTPEQAAEVAVKKATVFTADVNSGLIPDEALAQGRVNQLIEDGIYPGLDQAIADVMKEQGGLLIPEDDDKEPGGEGDPTDPLNADPAAADPAAAKEPTLEPAKKGLRLVISSDAAAWTDAAPRTLYIRRDVENWESLAAWAKGQGFAATVGKEMHVTIAYSRSRVDWTKVPDYGNYEEDDRGRVLIKAGGMRLVERLGPKAVVLMFSSSALSFRHSSICRHPDVSWDFDDYQPHVTISWDVPADVDLGKFEPYRGAIVLGPEIWEEVEEQWAAGIAEDGVAAT